MCNSRFRALHMCEPTDEAGQNQPRAQSGFRVFEPLHCCDARTFAGSPRRHRNQHHSDCRLFLLPVVRCGFCGNVSLLSDSAMTRPCLRAFAILMSAGLLNGAAAQTSMSMVFDYATVAYPGATFTQVTA